jgi:threonine/homoserine/homoserine lactone efflux protein
MSTDQIIGFVVFALVAAITPGPSNIILASTGANVGLLRGLPCLLGVSLGMGMMMFVVAFGLGSVVLESEFLLHLLKWCGVAMLLWLSWKIASAGRGDLSSAPRIVGVWQAAAFQWINPKSWLVCASAVGTYLHADDAGAFTQSILFGLIFILVSLPCCSIWLSFGASAQRVLRSGRAQRVFNVAMGLVLAGSTVLFIR